MSKIKQKNLKLKFNYNTNQKIFNKYKKLIPYFFYKIADTRIISKETKEDIISNANLALWKAIQNRSTKDEFLKTFLIIKIRGSIIDSLRKRTKIYEKNYLLAKKVKQIINNERNLYEEKLLTIKNNKHKQACILDYAYEYALEYKLLDCKHSFSDFDPLIKKETIKYFDEIISKLNKLEQLIISEYYFNDKSFVRICQENKNLSKSWVSKVHKSAINKIKEFHISSNNYKEIRLQA